MWSLVKNILSALAVFFKWNFKTKESRKKVDYLKEIRSVQRERQSVLVKIQKEFEGKRDEEKITNLNLELGSIEYRLRGLKEEQALRFTYEQDSNSDS